MPQYINYSANRCASCIKKNAKQELGFLKNTLVSLKVITLMLAKFKKAAESTVRLPEVNLVMSDINLPSATIARLFYVHEYGTPHEFNYDFDKLADIYIKYKLPWDEEICPTDIYKITGHQQH